MWHCSPKFLTMLLKAQHLGLQYYGYCNPQALDTKRDGGRANGMNATKKEKGRRVGFQEFLQEVTLKLEPKWQAQVLPFWCTLIATYQKP